MAIHKLWRSITDSRKFRLEMTPIFWIPQKFWEKNLEKDSIVILQIISVLCKFLLTRLTVTVMYIPCIAIFFEPFEQFQYDIIYIYI